MHRRPAFTMTELLAVVALCASIMAFFVAYRRMSSGHDYPAQLTMSADGTSVAAQFSDGSVTVWDVSSRSVRSVFNGSENDKFLQNIALNADGSLLAIHHFLPNTKGGFEPSVEVWDTRTARNVNSLRIGDGNVKSAFSPTDDRMASNIHTPNADVVLWNLKDKQIETVGSLARFGQNYGEALAFSPDGSVLAIGYTDGSIELWDIPAKKSRTTLRYEFTGPIHSLQFDDGGQCLAMCGETTLQQFHNLRVSIGRVGERISDINLIQNARENLSVGMLADGNLIVAADHRLSIYDAANQMPTDLLDDLKLTPLVAASPRGKLFAVSSNKEITLWDAATKQPVGTLSSDARTQWLLWIGAVSGYLWFILLLTMARKYRRTNCVECGRSFAPWKNITVAGLVECPHCGKTSQPEKHIAAPLRRRIMLALIIGFCFGLPLILKAAFGLDYWLGLIGTAVAVFGLSRFMVNYIARLPWLAFLPAQRIAGDQGAVTQLGPILIWSATGTAIGSLVETELAAYQTVFEKWIGPIRREKPLRVTCFAKRNDFERFLARYYATPTDVFAGIYVLTHARQEVLCEADLPERVTSPRTLLHNTLGLYMNERYFGFHAVYWFSRSLAGGIALALDESARAAALRKAKVAAARGGLLTAADLFRTPDHEMMLRLNLHSHTPDVWQLDVLSAQMKLLGDYLFGNGATDERRGQYRRFVQGLMRHDNLEARFTQHFGYGYDQLYADWKAWMLAQPDGPHVPPPKEIHDAIVHKLVPVIRDPDAPLEERRKLIRRLGSGGYVTGADALIDLLRPVDEISNCAARPLELRQPAIDALEFISGQTFGDDPARWDAWWEEVQASGACGPETLAR